MCSLRGKEEGGLTRYRRPMREGKAKESEKVSVKSNENRRKILFPRTHLAEDNTVRTRSLSVKLDNGGKLIEKNERT